MEEKKTKKFGLKKWWIALIIIAIVLALFSIIIEQGKIVRDVQEIGEIRSYADPIAKSILLGMQEDDYAVYSGYFTETMKNSMPQEVFLEQNIIIKSKIGDYVSETFWKIEKNDSYIIVYYKARFSEEDKDVIIKIVLQEIENKMYVAGLWLISSKLR